MTAAPSPPPTYRAPYRVQVPLRIGVPAALALALFLLGPRVTLEERVTAVELGQDVEAYLDAAEDSVPNVRPGERKEIVWADASTRSQTPLSVVYLHGFSADRHELDPVPERLAEALGANLFSTRLSGHGQDGPALGEVEAGDWLQDAEEALTVGARIGERVVLVGMSTGAALAVWAGAQDRWRDRLEALVLISPNFRPRDRSARVLLLPWGGLIARAIIGRERCFEPENAAQERHWTTRYPTRALLPMMALVERVRTMDLSTVTTPALMVYSPADIVIDVGEAERVFGRLGAEPKGMLRVDDGGDPAHHVLAGDFLSPGTNQRVADAVIDFLSGLDRRGGAP